MCGRGFACPISASLQSRVSNGLPARSGARHFRPVGKRIPPPTLDDDESDLGEPMQLVADTGDTSADGEDLVTADEAVETSDGGDLLG